MNPASLTGFLLAFYCLWWLYIQQGKCIACGGRGKHKDGCPDAD